MTSSLSETISKRLKKIKLYSKHKTVQPLHMELTGNVEKEAIYKPLIKELIPVVNKTIDLINLHQYNEPEMENLKTSLAHFFNVDSIKSENIFITLNLYEFYESLTELFLQKDQKIFLYTEDHYNFAQEVKLLNSGRIVVDYNNSPARFFDEIIHELPKDDYKILLICSQDINYDSLKDLLDFIPDNIVVVLRTPSPIAFNFLKYGNKNVIILREFLASMTIVEPPPVFCISRKEIIDLLNKVQLPNKLDTLTLCNAKYYTGLNNPVDYKFKSPIRASEGYEEILKNLIRENVEMIESENEEYNLKNIAERIGIPAKEFVDFSVPTHFSGPGEDIKTKFKKFVFTESRFNYYSQRILLRTMLSEKITTERNKINYSNILLGAGSTQLLENVCRTFVSDGEGYKKLYKEKVLMPDYSTPLYTKTVLKQDAIVDYIPLDVDLTLNLQTLLDKINTLKPKIVILDNPRFIAGNYIDTHQLQTLLLNIPEHTIIVIDESLVEFAQNENNDFSSAIEFVRDFPNLIVLRTFSYLYAMAGMRLGYLVANENIVNSIESIRHPFDVSAYSLQMGILMLENGSVFEQFTLQYTQEQKDIMYQKLNKLGLFYIKSSTNSILIKTPMDSQDLQEELLAYKIKVLALKNNFIRVSMKQTHQNEHFLKSFEEVLSAHLHY